MCFHYSADSYLESTVFVDGGSPASSDSHLLKIICAIIIIGLDRSRV